MKLSNSVIKFLLPVAAAGTVALADDDAQAQQAGPEPVTLSPGSADAILQQGAVSGTGSADAVPAGSAAASSAAPSFSAEDLASLIQHYNPAVSVEGENQFLLPEHIMAAGWVGDVPEAQVVPQAQLLHDMNIRRQLSGIGDSPTGLVYLGGSLINVTDGQYRADRSFDVYLFNGASFGGSPDTREVTAELHGVPGVADGATFEWVLDHQRADAYMSIDLAGMINEIGDARGEPFNNDEVRLFAMDNFRHEGEGTLDPNLIVVLRYFSGDYEQIATAPVLSSAPNGGDRIGDVGYICPDAVRTDPDACVGTNGLPIRHITRNSMFVDLPGPYMIVHAKIEPCGSYGPGGVAGGIWVRRSLHGEPVSAPVYTAPPIADDEDTGVDVIIQQDDTPPTPPTPPAPDHGGPDPTDASGDYTPSTPAPDDGQDTVPETVPEIVPPTECNDCIDNDGDGLIDLADPDCADASDDDESGTAGQEEPAPAPEVSGQEDSLPNLLAGVRLLYVDGAALQHPGPLASLYLGGQLGDSPVYLVGLVGYGYGGSSSVRHPDSRTTLPDPDNPFGLTGVVEGSVYTSTHVLDAELELRYAPLDWLQVAVAGGVNVVFNDQDSERLDQVFYQNGELADEYHESSSDLDTHVLGVIAPGVTFRPHPNFGIGLRGLFGFDGDGLQEWGAGISLEGYFGGGNSSDEPEE